MLKGLLLPQIKSTSLIPPDAKNSEERRDGMKEQETRLVTVNGATYRLEIEPDAESGGYVASVPRLPGCITQGDTVEDVLDMAKDAIKCWLEAYEDLKQHGINVPLGGEKAK